MIYWVGYRMYGYGTEHIQVIARSKVEAYDKAVYDLIPEVEGGLPYSAWVESVTCQNGNYKSFNTHEGKPY